jgi:hypothetical protein
VLISDASDRWGVEPLDEGKSVWFELHAGGPPDDEVDVDALLAAWGDDLAEDPAHEQVRLVLTDLDTGLMARAEAHVEGVLRELCLLLSSDDVPAEAGRVARTVLQAAAGMDAVRADLKHQLAVAVSAGWPRVDLSLTVQRDDAALVRDYALAVDEADRLSRPASCWPVQRRRSCRTSAGRTCAGCSPSSPAEAGSSHPAEASSPMADLRRSRPGHRCLRGIGAQLPRRPPSAARPATLVSRSESAVREQAAALSATRWSATWRTPPSGRPRPAGRAGRRPIGRPAGQLRGGGRHRRPAGGHRGAAA